MKKKLVSVLTCGVLSMGLVGCGSEEKTATKSTSKNEVQTEEVAKDGTVIRGTGVPRLTSARPTIPLEKGKATINIKVKGANKSDRLMASVSQHLDETIRSTTSLTTVSGDGNFSKSETFNVPSEGKYDIHVDGYRLAPDFKGEWEVVVKQKPKKDKEFDKQLRLTSMTQNIGGEFLSSITPKDEYKKDAGYGSVISDIKITGANSISFQSLKEDSFVSTEMKDGKWKEVEKDTGKTKDQMLETRKTFPDAEFIDEMTTTKGPARLFYNNGKCYMVFEDVNASPEEVTVSEELATLLSSKGDKDIYWNFENKIVYTIVTDYSSEGKNKMYRYDLNKQNYISDTQGNQTTLVPFTHTSERIRFANDKKGNLYIASLPTNATNGTESYSVTVAAYNKDMKLLAKPTVVHGIYDYADKGRFEIAATDKGVEVWNIYDARVVNGNSYVDPVQIGANRFSLVLE
ncbi:hypothetical protein bcgnr5390_11610 [Bacillus luti]|nr:hypothetical protein BC2903_29300 [Bacillus cereus]